MAFHLTIKIDFFLLNNSLRLAYVVCAEQTIEEQKIKFDFYGEMEGHICGLLIYLTLIGSAVVAHTLFFQ